MVLQDGLFERDKYMIRRAGIEDARELADLAIQMWSDYDPEDLTEEMCKLAMNDEAVCFIKSVDGKLIGFRNASCGMIMLKERIVHLSDILKASSL